MLRSRSISILLPALLLVFGAMPNEAKTDTTDERFYRAFYLEHHEGDYERAAKLYAKVAKDEGAGKSIRRKARARLAVCKEELATNDFAALMPPNTICYVELNNPGEQVAKLLDQLGLLGDADDPDMKLQAGRVSPVLIKELMGIKGAAAAVTGFDPMNQTPMGVAVFHPGDVDVIRGLIETGLPIGGKPVESVGGYPTYSIEGEVFVTLTSRLVIVSPQRSQITGVVRRLKGEAKYSLATNKGLASALSGRDDSLIFFCINAKPIMPMINSMLAGGGGNGRQMAIARAVLDLESLHSLVGRAGVDDDGLFFELGLRLDEGHHNLVYNLFRTPGINEETLKCIPAGAAAFAVGALNEAPSRYGTTSGGSEGEQIVTLLDFGREIFANITGLGLFVLPPMGDEVEPGPPIPDIGLAFTVKDPSKTRALWTQILGIASLAAGANSTEGTPLRIKGVEVRSYQFQGGPTVYFATADNDALITTSRSAMARSLNARRTGKSILTDRTFAKSLSRVGPNTTKAVMVHVGRCGEIAKRFMSPSDLAEAEPFMKAMSDTVASLVVEHSDEQFRISAKITGIPDVGNIVTKLIVDEGRKQQRRNRLAKAKRSHNWDEALKIVNDQLSERPNDAEQLRAKFDILANGKKDRDAALACGEAYYDQMRDDAKGLNNFAWALLTDDDSKGGFSELALKLSERCNEITQQKNWMFVDTLALAKFETGDVSAAVDLQKKAIELAGGASSDELKGRLARFEEAVGETKLAGDASTPSPR